MFNIPQKVAYGLKGYILCYVVVFVHEMNFFTAVYGTNCLCCQEVFCEILMFSEKNTCYSELKQIHMNFCDYMFIKNRVCLEKMWRVNFLLKYSFTYPVIVMRF